LFYLKEEPDAGFSSTQPGIPIEYSSIKAKDIEYIVLSNILIQEGYAKFIGDIEKRSVLLKTFSPYKKGVERISPNEKSSIPAAGFMLQELKDRKSYGPVIRIYKIK
jgi:hypothetical protein